ncbi:MAG: ribulokinase [Verrucomicrobiales bacterium]|jgi:L-ribulokinase|nr:ribulokinase [Verrucomicrobiales bacterium]
MSYTLGIDYGTNSVRALIVSCADGGEIGTGVFDYPSGNQGVLLDPNDHHLARQNPADYLLGLEHATLRALAQARRQRNFSAEQIIGIGVDSTGSSPLPVDATNTPLALTPKWRDHPAAQCWLWKDHTAHREAAEITRLAAQHRPHYLAKCGQVYSSEWFWSKIWRCLKTAPEVFADAESWIELCDFIPSVLAGVTNPRLAKRGVCAAGHKALYHDGWGGLPDREFLALLDPRLAELRDRLYQQACDATVAAGALCPAWAEKLGLRAGIPIAIGEMDVHYGAIGSGIKEGVLVKAIGTSTCDCAIVSGAEQVADIPGVCGVVKGAILPGYYGIEAGQSAVGDIFKWWIETICQGDAAVYQQLEAEAAALRPAQSGLLALDWNNGNRTVLVDPLLTGLLAGQTLYTTRAEVYRALIEATAFGARAIIERLKEYGVPIVSVVCCGGIAEKNPLLMQIYADTLGVTISVAGSSQACALGAAVAAAVVAGADRGGYATFAEAQARMTSLKPAGYSPHPRRRAVYDQLYTLYRRMHDAFGGADRDADLSRLMKELIRLKQENTR